METRVVVYMRVASAEQDTDAALAAAIRKHQTIL